MVMFWRYLIKPLTCLMQAIARMTLVHLFTPSIDPMPKWRGALALTKQFKFLRKRHRRLSNRPLSRPGPQAREHEYLSARILLHAEGGLTPLRTLRTVHFPSVPYSHWPYQLALRDVRNTKRKKSVLSVLTVSRSSDSARNSFGFRPR